MSNTTPSAVYLLLLCFSFVHLVRSSCPSGPDVSCCACVSTPGCSWFRSGGHCSSSPYLNGVPPELADGTGAIPTYPSSVTVTANQALHLGRSRLVAPQRARVAVAIGARYQLPFRVTSRESRIRLQVRGPANNTGEVEFSLRRADSDSCVRGLREVIRRRGSRRMRGGSRRAVFRSSRTRRSTDPRARPFPRRRKYKCRGGGQGYVHNLFLNLDVKRCLNRPVQVKVVVKDGSSSSRLRIRVDSQCQCPACSENASPRESDGSGGEGRRQNGDAASTSSSSRASVGTNCTSNQAGSQRCGTVQLAEQLRPQATLCLRRGVNEVCDTTDEFGPTCSSRGDCLCGECVCRVINPGSFQRFTGLRCECDDFSCNRSLGALCGGPQRGRCQCGRCACYPGYQGEACESSTREDRCRNYQGVSQNSGNDPPPVCSGRGTCVDGMCECSWPYTGSYCECDNAACPRHQGQLCGGTRGQCVCGHCLCAPGYAGDACEVESGRLSYEAEGWGQGPPQSCLSPVVDGVAEEGGPEGWGLVCSGRGVCLQGTCRCPSPYTGSLCQDCPTCN